MPGSHLGLPSGARRRVAGTLTAVVAVLAVVLTLVAYGAGREDDTKAASASVATRSAATQQTHRTNAPTPTKVVRTVSRKVVKAQRLVHKKVPKARTAAAHSGPPYDPSKEVWQAAQPAHTENPTNPLANRRWGVYTGNREDTWKAYRAASGANKQLLAKIALRPKATWLGDWSASPQRIGPEMDKYIANMSGGDPNVLVQMSIFRMEPWEHAACGGGPGLAQRAAYRTWISNAAAAIGSQHTAIILQPDLPFWFCTDRAAVSQLMKFSVDTFESLPNTSVYLDAGAADWTMTPQSSAQAPSQAADLLMANGIEKARGFALNATHYMGTAESVAWGSRIVQILASRGVHGVHFVTDTAQNGNPMRFRDVQIERSKVADNARTCKSTSDRRGCVTLGIPPTSRVGDQRWGLPAEQREQAKKYVDGFLWYGRAWMYMQAHWEGPQRALDMARSTSWPGPPG